MTHLFMLTKMLHFCFCESYIWFPSFQFFGIFYLFYLNLLRTLNSQCTSSEVLKSIFTSFANILMITFCPHFLPIFIIWYSLVRPIITFIDFIILTKYISVLFYLVNTILFYTFLWLYVNHGKAVVLILALIL